MKLKKNVVPLGSSGVASARISGNEAQFFMAGDGIIVRKTYDLETRSLKTDSSPVAYADSYLLLENGSVQDLGEVVYVSGK